MALLHHDSPLTGIHRWQRWKKGRVTVNEEILDRALRHAHYFERLKSHEVNQIIAYLNREVYPDMIRQVRARLKRAAIFGVETGPITTRRMREITAAVSQIVDEGYKIAYEKIETSMVDVGIHEANWQAQTLKESVPKVFNIDFNTPSPAMIRSAVTSRPFQTKLLGDTIRNITRKQGKAVTKALEKAIKMGAIEGETIEQIVRRIRGTKAMKYADGILTQPRRHVAALVRTSAGHVANRARAATLQENSDVMKGWQFVATLDGSTTEVCMGHDGDVYSIGSIKWQPPLHWGCRSTLVPVLKSWQELGIDAREIPETDRSSMDGYVPAKEKYPEWLKRQPIEFQNEALGIGRAQVFRRGLVDIKQFVNREGHPLTLRELLSLEAQIQAKLN